MLVPMVAVDAKLRASVLIGDRKPGGGAKPPTLTPVATAAAAVPVLVASCAGRWGREPATEARVTLPAVTVELELVVTLLALMALPMLPLVVWSWSTLEA